MTYLVTSDTHINTDNEDLLSFGDKADDLTTILLGAQPPTMIGLFSPWGSGKSSMLRLIRNRIDANTPYPQMQSRTAVLPIIFDSWDHEDPTGLIPNLLLRIGDVIEEQNIFSPEQKTTIKQAAGRAAGAFLTVLGNTALRTASQGAFDLNMILDAAERISGDDSDSWRDQAKQNPHKLLTDEMAKLLRTIHTLGYSRVAFLVDDVDRCHPANVFSFLDNMRRLVAFSVRAAERKNQSDTMAGFIGIIAADEKILSNAIDLRYPGAGSDTYGHLSKLITIRQRIPHPTEEQFTAFLKGKVPARAGDEAHHKQVIAALAKVAAISNGSLTPRHILTVLRQYVTSFVVQDNADPIGPFSSGRYTSAQLQLSVIMSLLAVVDPPRGEVLLSISQQKAPYHAALTLALNEASAGSANGPADRKSYHDKFARSLEADWSGFRHVPLLGIIQTLNREVRNNQAGDERTPECVMDAARRIVGNA